MSWQLSHELQWKQYPNYGCQFQMYLFNVQNFLKGGQFTARVIFSSPQRASLLTLWMPTQVQACLRRPYWILHIFFFFKIKDFYPFSTHISSSITTTSFSSLASVRCRIFLFTFTVFTSTRAVMFLETFDFLTAFVIFVRGFADLGRRLISEDNSKRGDSSAVSFCSCCFCCQLFFCECYIVIILSKLE